MIFSFARVKRAKFYAIVFLEKHDKGRVYGGLERVVMKNGDVRWMCPEHVREISLEQEDDWKSIVQYYLR